MGQGWAQRVVPNYGQRSPVSAAGAEGLMECRTRHMASMPRSDGANSLPSSEPTATLSTTRGWSARSTSDSIITCAHPLAPGLGSPQPHRHRDWGHRVHRTGRNEPSAPPGRAAPIRARLQRVWVATAGEIRSAATACAAGTNARMNGSSRSCVRARTNSRRRRVAFVPPGLPPWGLVRDRCAGFRRPCRACLTGPRDLRRRRLPTLSTSA